MQIVPNNKRAWRVYRLKETAHLVKTFVLWEATPITKMLLALASTNYEVWVSFQSVQKDYERVKTNLVQQLLMVPYWFWTQVKMKGTYFAHREPSWYTEILEVRQWLKSIYYVHWLHFLISKTFLMSQNNSQMSLKWSSRWHQNGRGREPFAYFLAAILYSFVCRILDELDSWGFLLWEPSSLSVWESSTRLCAWKFRDPLSGFDSCADWACLLAIRRNYFVIFLHCWYAFDKKFDQGR